MFFTEFFYSCAVGMAVYRSAKVDLAAALSATSSNKSEIVGRQGNMSLGNRQYVDSRRTSCGCVAICVAVGEANFYSLKGELVYILLLFDLERKSFRRCGRSFAVNVFCKKVETLGSSVSLPILGSFYFFALEGC